MSDDSFELVRFGCFIGAFLGFLIANIIFSTSVPQQITDTDCYVYQQQILCTETK